MEELLRQALAILRAMWRHRWLGLIVAWLVGAVAAVIVVRIPDRYEAAARIYVDTDSLLRPLMAGLAVQPNVEQRVVMLSRTLISRPNVEKLVRMADLDLNAKSKSAQEALIEHVTKTLEISSAGRDNLYTLSYRDPDPGKAKRVVQSLTTIFVDSALSKQKDSNSAVNFLAEQISSYEKKLADAEARLKEFKLRNIDLQLGEGASLTGRASQISQELQQARLELREAENAREALRRQITSEEPTVTVESPSFVPEIATTEFDSRIDALKKNLDAMLQRYTERHPDVINAQRMIKDLEEQKRQELAARKKTMTGKPGSTVSTNPVYQQLKVSLNEAEARVASLRARVGELGGRYNRAVTVIKTQPELEAELTQLNRDYEIHKRNYAALVERRETATLSGELEQTGSVADFRLIDPPRASTSPVAPNRMVLLPIALLVALGAGVGSSFVASQLRPVFFDGRTLRDVTGLPILGSVSLIKHEADLLREKKSNRRFAIVFVALIGVFAAGVAALSFLSGRVA